MSRHLSSALFLLALTACGGAETTTEETPAPAPVPAPVVEADTEAAEQAAADVLVPSPSETQKAVEAAGIETELATLIEHPEINTVEGSEDQVAVSTGVVVADLLLTAKTSSNDQLVAQLDSIQQGMKKLEGGSDIDAILEDLKSRVATESITRDELVSELEALSGAIIPELEFNGRARIVPLIQAGSWLEASNLLSRALLAAHRPDAADALLKQPEVVEYFQSYASDHGMDAPLPVTETLLAALDTLSKVSNKDGALAEDDLTAVRDATQSVLALL